MPFCPNCRYEYNPGVSKCHDCDVELVVSLPEEPQGKVYERWIQLARLSSLQYTHMLEQALHEKGIPIVVHSGVGHFGVTGQMGISARPIGGGYSIMVPEEFVVAADSVASGMLGEEWEAARLVDIELDEGAGPRE